LLAIATQSYNIFSPRAVGRNHGPLLAAGTLSSVTSHVRHRRVLHWRPPPCAACPIDSWSGTRTTPLSLRTTARPCARVPARLTMFRSTARPCAVSTARKCAARRGDGPARRRCTTPAGRRRCGGGGGTPVPTPRPPRDGNVAVRAPVRTRGHGAGRRTRYLCVAERATALKARVLQACAWNARVISCASDGKLILRGAPDAYNAPYQ